MDNGSKDLVGIRYCDKKHDDLEKLIAEKAHKVFSVLSTRLDGNDRALLVLKEVTEARLDVLNHLRSDVEKDREYFARKDVVNPRIDNLFDWKSSVNDQLTRIDVTNNAKLNRQNVFSIISLVFVALMFIFQLYLHFGK